MSPRDDEFSRREVEDFEDEYDDEEEDEILEPVRISYRAAGSDPTFGFLVALALNIGLAPLVPANADLRYAIAWLALGVFGVLAWLIGETDRIEQETLENLVWGVVFGLIIGAPLLVVGGDTLVTTVHLIFRSSINDQIVPLPNGAVLAFLVFVMPTAETLFFRGLMQYTRPFWLVSILSSVWSILLFLPMIEAARYPAIAFLIGTALTLMSFTYSYVRRRNGLAAAWLCQITINLVLLFIPYIAR